MAQTDSVSVFAEGTFEEQIHELVDFIAATKPEADRVALKEPFAKALRDKEGQKPIEEDDERRRELISQVVSAVEGIGDGSEKEIEGFFNLLFSHLVTLYSSDSPEFQTAILKLVTVISQQDTAEQISLKYRILANLFNIVPRTSPARLLVCKTLLKAAQDNEELENLRLTPADVDRWLTEWNASAEEKSNFLKSIADAFSSAGQHENAFDFSVSHVRSLPPSEATGPALQLVASALRIPSIFDFNSVVQLDSVQALESNELFILLDIFNKHGLEEFNDWREKNQSVVDEYQLDATELERKLRLLLLSEVGFSKIGHDVSYGEIASVLQVEASEVEKWVIDGIRAGLLSGKLSQSTRTLRIVRASPRSFAQEQWKVLEQRLLAWKEGLAGIHSVLSATRHSATAVTIPEQVA